jgi:curved DNA-binding protein CbpA
MDPFALLGVDDGVSEQELAAAFRQQAQRWHPDHEGGDEARMRELNDAYALARAEVRRRLRDKPYEPVVRKRTNPGSWLPDAVRKRLGWELLTALGEGEEVRLVASAGRTGIGPAVLALTDRRLLWLAEDAVSARIDWVRFGLVSDVEQKRTRLGRRATLRLRTRTGRRVSFGDLRPEAAETIAKVLAG